MEPRINMMTNELGAKIAKRIYNVSLAIEQSPLPKATQHLVMLRASQINGCAWCVDLHRVSDETWARARKHYDDDQLVALVAMVAMINASTRLGVILNDQGGAYEPGMFTSMSS